MRSKSPLNNNDNNDDINVLFAVWPVDTLFAFTSQLQIIQKRLSAPVFECERIQRRPAEFVLRSTHPVNTYLLLGRKPFYHVNFNANDRTTISPFFSKYSNDDNFRAPRDIALLDGHCGVAYKYGLKKKKLIFLFSPLTPRHR